jgi:hypothetical protein
MYGRFLNNAESRFGRARRDSELAERGWRCADPPGKNEALLTAKELGAGRFED